MAIKAILLKYNDVSKAYKCYDVENRKIYICKHVRFDETMLGYEINANDVTFEDQFL